MKATRLDTQWHQLMSLCESESSFRAEGNHSRVVKLLESEIELLATDMGFSARLIGTREFRAVREGGHIISIVVD